MPTELETTKAIQAQRIDLHKDMRTRAKVIGESASSLFQYSGGRAKGQMLMGNNENGIKKRLQR